MEDTQPRPKMLVVEDHPSCQLLLELWLSQDGFDVRTAADGAEALTLLLVEPFDLVLLGLRLSRVNGLDVVRRIRAAGKTVPIIAVVAKALPSEREECVTAGVDGYVTKPCRRDQLLEEIGLVLSGGWRARV